MSTQTLTEEFREATNLALMKAMREPNDAIRYMATHIPIYRQYEATDDMRKAGGCPDCEFLGLWTQEWPGYENSQHGLIILFERGIRYKKRDLWQQCFDTLIHEFGHALQEDHVLDAMEAERRRAHHTTSRGDIGG